jgi:hypothetical protein
LIIPPEPSPARYPSIESPPLQLIDPPFPVAVKKYIAIVPPAPPPE